MTGAFAAASFGSAVGTLIGGNRTAVVAGRFARALHLRFADELLCLGGADIGNGPCNVLLAGASAWDRFTAAAEHITAWRIVGRSISGGGVVVDLDTAEPWRQPDWPGVGRHDAVRATASQLREIIAAEAPADGLAGTIVGRPARDPTGRAAARHVQELRAFLAGPSEPAPPPVGLLGLGPGLTPSGDDVLAGALLMLSAFGRCDQRSRLAEPLLAGAKRRTTFFSAALLGQAARGQGGEDIVRAVAAVASGRSGDIDGSVMAAGQHGACSGWDTLAGAWLAVDALTAVR